MGAPGTGMFGNRAGGVPPGATPVPRAECYPRKFSLTSRPPEAKTRTMGLRARGQGWPHGPKHERSWGGGSRIPGPEVEKANNGGGE